MTKIILTAILIGINYLVLNEAFKDRKLKEGIRWLLGRKVMEKPDYPDFSVTVLIPAYNEEDFIRETIESLQNQNFEIDKILVVDDSSTDNTANIARDAGANVVTTPQNKGTKAQAQDYGLQFVDTDLVINVDADTTLDEKAIEKMVPIFKDDKVAAACGFVVPRRIRSIWERARFVQYLFGMSFFKVGQDLWNGILVASGCFSGFKTDLLKEFGGFPDRSIAEDMDITWEILKAGMKVKLVPDAYCYPVSPHDYSTYRAQVERWNRGFLQNIQAHGLSLLRNRRVAFFVVWNMGSGILIPAQLGILAFLVIRFGSLVLLALAIGVMLPVGYSLAKARELNLTRQALTSFPFYLLVLWVNSYLFFKAVWLEWVRKRNLNIWQKGHGK